MSSKIVLSATSEQPLLSDAPTKEPAENNYGSTLLDIRDLYVEYETARGPVRAVDGVSFSIAPGEVFGLAGESGSGKSTIAHSIMRLLHPPAIISGGNILFNGRDVLEMNQAQLEAFRWSGVSMVFQSAMNSLNPVMKISDQIADVLMRHDKKMGKRAARERASELLDVVGIDRLRLDSYPHELS